MTEATPAAPSAAETAIVPADPPQAEQQQDEGQIWKEIEAEEAKAADQPAAAPAEAADAPEAQPGPEPAKTPQTPPAAAPAPAEVDIWANATPEQKAAFEAANAERAKFEQRSRSASGRISALQRKLNAAQAQPSRTETPAREAVAGIETDYPEIAQPLAKVAEAVDGQREQIKKQTQDSIDADTAELNELVAEETALLVAKHPDYVDVLKANGPAFKAWVDDQPLRIRQAAIKNASYIADSEGAIKVLDGFKQHLAQIAPPAQQQQQQPAPAAPAAAPQPALDDRRQRQLAGNAAPTTPGGRPTVSGIPEDGDPKALWDQWDAHDKARERA